jgi:hypothetical protein
VASLGGVVKVVVPMAQGVAEDTMVVEVRIVLLAVVGLVLPKAL